MKKIKMLTNQKLTFEEGCNKYLEYCRQISLNHVQIKDVDFDNDVVYVIVTKNRKPLIVPLNQ